MKGGHTPIHIMRVAPADYVNDPFVRRCYQKRDYKTAAFYPVFLFYSHLEGGDLSADLDDLAAVVLMPLRDVEWAVGVCKAAGKLEERDGRLFHKRVRREVVAELEYREVQRVAGKRGGRPPKTIDKDRVAEGELKGSLSDNQTPPAPSSAPSSAPAPKPRPGSQSAEDDAAMPALRAESWRRLRAVLALSGEDGQAEYSRASRLPDGGSLLTPDTCRSAAWLRTTNKRLQERELALTDQRRQAGHRPETPAERETRLRAEPPAPHPEYEADLAAGLVPTLPRLGLGK